MALMKGKVPKDGVVMTELEAMDYVWDLVTNWESPWDTWALRYSPAMSGGISSFTGLAINKFYRKKLKLGAYGHMASLIPLTFLPGVFSALFHNKFVTTDMLLMKRDTCPLCYELRSLGIQLGFGIAYPMVLGPWTAFMFASRYSTVRLPSLTTEPKEVFKYFLKISKPFSSSLLYLGIAQVVVSSAVTYCEMKNNLTMRRKLLELEKKMVEEALEP